MSTDFVSFTKDFCVGGVSATIAKTIIAPIERIKLILQVQHGAEQIAKSQRYKGKGQDTFFVIDLNLIRIAFS